MRKPLRKAMTLSMSLAALSLSGGCGENSADGPGGPSVPPGPTGPPMASPPGSPGIKQIMAKLAKGPNSLTPVLGNALKAEPPAWETIQPQTKEFAQLAAELGRYDPPKGSKESWSKLTMAYAESASALDGAARAKDKKAALAAHAQLARSCMSCHQEHRGGPGMGGPPGFGPPGGLGPKGPGSGPPPEGPPPGGPPPGDLQPK